MEQTDTVAHTDTQTNIQFCMSHTPPELWAIVDPIPHDPDGDDKLSLFNTHLSQPSFPYPNIRPTNLTSSPLFSINRSLSVSVYLFLNNGMINEGEKDKAKKNSCV